MGFFKKLTKALSNKWVRAGLSAAGALNAAGAFGSNNIVSSAIGLGNIASGASSVARKGANFGNISQIALGGYNLYQGKGFGLFDPTRASAPVPMNRSGAKANDRDDDGLLKPTIPTTQQRPIPSQTAQLLSGPTPILKPGTVAGEPASPTSGASAKPAPTPALSGGGANNNIPRNFGVIGTNAAPQPKTLADVDPWSRFRAAPAAPGAPAAPLPIGYKTGMPQQQAAPTLTANGNNNIPRGFGAQQPTPVNPPSNFATPPKTPIVAAPPVPTTTMQTSGGGQSLAPNPNAPFVAAPQLTASGSSEMAFNMPAAPQMVAAPVSPPVQTTQAAANITSQEATQGLQGYASQWFENMKKQMLEKPELALQAGSALIGLFASDPAEVAAKAYAKEKAEILKRMDPSSNVAKEYSAAYTETRKQQLDEMYKLQRAQLAAAMAQRGMTDSTVGQQAFLDMDSKYAELSSKIPYDAQQAWLTYSQALLANYGVAATGAAQAAQVAANGASSAIPSFSTLGQSVGAAAASQ